MRRALIRPLLALLALSVWWLLVLGWAARVSPSDPWLPSAQITRSGSDALSVFGVTVADPKGARVNALGPRNLALQSFKFRTPIAAEDFSVLHYRILDFPHSLELALIFRRADLPADVISVSLPWPGPNGASIDLGQIEQWQGEIVEIGFSEFPAAHVASMQLPFQPFVVAGIQLESRSWSGLLHALRTDWLAYMPWSQRSINALGRGQRLPQPRAILPVVALGLAGSVLLLWGILRLRSRVHALQIGALVIVAGWLLIDARWMWVLAQRQQSTQSLYAGKDWDQRKSLQMDADLMAFAARISAMVEAMGKQTKVLLWSWSSFDEGRLAYHLRPLNVAVLYPGTRPDLSKPVLLVIDDRKGQWEYSTASGELRGPSWRFVAQRIYQQGKFGLYRLETGGTP